MTKLCRPCNTIKNLDEFFNLKRSFDGKHNACKVCVALRNKESHARNKEVRNKRKNEYYHNNKEKFYEQQKVYRDNNLEKVKANVKKYSIEHKQEILAYRRMYWRERRKNDIQYKLQMNLRKRLREALKGKSKNSRKAIKDLGCTIEFLQNYLESQFVDGMNWYNYGIRAGQWSIDHIIPLSKVDLLNTNELLKVCNYKNLRLMWHIDNAKKSNKII